MRSSPTRTHALRLSLLGLVLSCGALGGWTWADDAAVAATVATETTQATRAQTIRAHMLNASDPSVLVVSHRGLTACEPENSIGAIRDAIDAGVHVVELDVRVTKDHKHVLMHDGTIDRTTTGKGKVSDMTLAEIRSFQLMHALRPSAEVAPTLEEAFEAARDRILINIDPKGIDIPGAAELARGHGMLEQCVFKAGWKSIDEKMLAWLDENPDVYFMPICEGTEQIEAALAARQWPAMEVLVRSEDDALWTRAGVMKLREKGVRPWINTLWDGRLSAGVGDEDAIASPAETYKGVIGLGYGFIQTDLGDIVIGEVRKLGLDPARP